MPPQASAQQTTHDDRGTDDRGSDDQRADAPAATDSLRKTLTAKNRVHTVVPETARAAREQVGLSLEEAIRRSKLEHLAELEAGQWHPTYAQLDYLAEVYMVPCWVLHEHELPKSAKFDIQIPEFHKFEGVPLDVDYKLRCLLERVSAMRTLVLDLAETSVEDVKRYEPPVTLPPDGDITEQELQVTADKVVEWLDLDDVTATFEQRRQAVEDLGVHVFLTSPTRHWSKIDQRVFSGFVVPKDTLPILVINGRASEGDRSFSLFHALAHLLTNQVSYDGTSVVDHHGVDNAVQVMCDRLAACVLWRGARFEAIMREVCTLETLDISEFEKVVDPVAKEWDMNAWSAAVRLEMAGVLTATQFRKLNVAFARRAQGTRAGRPPSDTLTGYREVLRRFGGRYVGMIVDAYHDRELTLVKACKFTELNVHEFLEHRQ